MKKVLLISNRVMHYRVSTYNYFHRRFRESGFEFSVIADCLQKQNQILPEFELRELPLNFLKYRKAIVDAQPDAVILFLWMKDLITWPLIHWLKLRKIPFAWWTKGGNWDARESRLRYQLSNYVHAMSDALILYSASCRELVKPGLRSKSFVANNTINFSDFPAVHESKEEIKKEFGIPFEKVVIFIGRMGVEKGRKRVDHLIDIFRGLDRKDIGLVLVGSGLGEELKARMNPRNTLYLGEVHDAQNLRISKLCKMADVCAIPGHVGLGLNQALYWGLPVVTEECDQPPEISYLKPGRNGFVVPHNDLASLQDRMLYLLDNDRVRADFSRHAREDILNEASIEGMFCGFKDCVNYLTQR
ncbi:MAG: glycosyltransferase family 4 protein [Acidobacteriia bacterium]|nr:glycosyltransferase family 4 protein [Terriglobia bacterium]